MLKIIRILSLIANLKMEGIVKWSGLKSQGPLQTIYAIPTFFERYLLSILVQM